MNSLHLHKERNKQSAGIKIAVTVFSRNYKHNIRRKCNAIFINRQIFTKKRKKYFMKISSEDIRAIPVGTSTTFIVDHPRRIDTAKTLAYRLNALEEGKRYTCKSNFAKRKITITANPA